MSLFAYIAAPPTIGFSCAEQTAAPLNASTAIANVGKRFFIFLILGTRFLFDPLLVYTEVRVKWMRFSEEF
jgi:hypothetical protein